MINYRLSAYLNSDCLHKKSLPVFLKDWPHSAVQAALTKLYGFCSDYPGIRHAGNPAGVRRELNTRDVTLASLLLLSFSGYVSKNINEQVILGI